MFNPLWFNVFYKSNLFKGVHNKSICLNIEFYEWMVPHIPNQSDIANFVELILHNNKLGLLFMYSTYFTYSPFDGIYKRHPWKTHGN